MTFMSLNLIGKCSQVVTVAGAVEVAAEGEVRMDDSLNSFFLLAIFSSPTDPDPDSVSSLSIAQFCTKIEFWDYFTR